MGMASAARQQQMQPQPGQRPQLGGGKGRPNPAQQPAQQPQGGFGKIASQMGTQMGGLQPGATFMGGTVTPDTIGPNGQRVGGTMPPQLGNPMPPQLGGGKGQPGATSNVPAYAQPYIGNMMNNEQLPVPTMQPPSPLGAAAAGLGGGKGQPSQMGGLSGMSDLQRQALQQGEMTNPYIRPAAGIYDAVGREMPGGMGDQNRAQVMPMRNDMDSYINSLPAPNEYSVARQPMLQPAVQPSQMPQMNQEQMLQQYQTMLRGAPAPVAALAPVAQPVAAAPKPFVSQPVQKESPRQTIQRRMQRMAAARRGMR
jgi:hypothetical protein